MQGNRELKPCARPSNYYVKHELSTYGRFKNIKPAVVIRNADVIKNIVPISIQPHQEHRCNCRCNSEHSHNQRRRLLAIRVQDIPFSELKERNRIASQVVQRDRR